MANATAKLSTPLLIIALVILAGFSYLLYEMYTFAGTDQAQMWERRMVLYGTVEALAFTAAGYLFGKEVHREQAEKAEERADKKTTETEQAKAQAAEETAKGRTLANLIEVKRSSATGGGELASLRTRVGGDLSQVDLAEIAELAKRLFPTRG